MRFPDGGACIGQDPGHWDTDYPGWNRGRAICNEVCTAKAQCLEWVMAVEHGTGHGRSGIVAGLTPDERADLAGNHNRKPTYDRCHTCNQRMAYADDRPVKVRKQASDAACMSCWTRDRQPTRPVRPSERRAS